MTAADFSAPHAYLPPWLELGAAWVNARERIALKFAAGHAERLQWITWAADVATDILALARAEQLTDPAGATRPLATYLSAPQRAQLRSALERAMAAEFDGSSPPHFDRARLGWFDDERRLFEVLRVLDAVAVEEHDSARIADNLIQQIDEAWCVRVAPRVEEADDPALVESDDLFGGWLQFPEYLSQAVAVSVATLRLDWPKALELWRDCVLAGFLRLSLRDAG